MQDRICDAAKELAKALNVHRPDEHAVRRQRRDSLRHRSEPARRRTAPFVSKAIGVPLPKLAAKIMASEA